VTIAIAIVVSGFISLTLTPMLCARVLRGHHEGEQKKPVWILRVFERALIFGSKATSGRSTGARLQVGHADGHHGDDHWNGVALYRHSKASRRKTPASC
jgi:multidrug efflux pump subunit AcrB